MAGPENKVNAIDVQVVKGKIESSIDAAEVKRIVGKLNNEYGNTEAISDAVMQKIQSYNWKNSPLFSQALEYKIAFDEGKAWNLDRLRKAMGSLGFKNQAQTVLSNRSDTPDVSSETAKAKLLARQQAANEAERAQNQSAQTAKNDEKEISKYARNSALDRRMQDAGVK